MSKIIRIFPIFFSLRNIWLNRRQTCVYYQIIYFFEKILYFLRMCRCFQNWMPNFKSCIDLPFKIRKCCSAFTTFNAEFPKNFLQGPAGSHTTKLWLSNNMIQSVEIYWKKILYLSRLPRLRGWGGWKASYLLIGVFAGQIGFHRCHHFCGFWLGRVGLACCQSYRNQVL